MDVVMVILYYLTRNLTQDNIGRDLLESFINDCRIEYGHVPSHGLGIMTHGIWDDGVHPLDVISCSQVFGSYTSNITSGPLARITFPTRVRYCNGTYVPSRPRRPAPS